MSFSGPRVAYGDAGSLRLSVNYIGQAAAEAGGWRSRFLYRVDGPPGSSPSTFIGSDLYSGVSAETTAREMLQALAAFLADAGERYASRMSAPDDDYPEWVYEAAYLNSDELGLLAEGIEEPAGAPAVRVEHVSIVFFEGDEAEEALALLESEAPPAAIEHLAQWDYGEETEMAARRLAHVYPKPPASEFDQTWVEGDYTLSWSVAFRHVALTRRVSALTRRVSAPVAPGDPAGQGASARGASATLRSGLGTPAPLSPARPDANRPAPER